MTFANSSLSMAYSIAAPSNPVSQYVAEKLQTLIAPNRRFKDKATFDQVLSAISIRYGEPGENILQPANERQARLLAAILGIGDSAHYMEYHDRLVSAVIANQQRTDKKFNEEKFGDTALERKALDDLMLFLPKTLAAANAGTLTMPQPLELLRPPVKPPATPAPDAKDPKEPPANKPSQPIANITAINFPVALEENGLLAYAINKGLRFNGLLKELQQASTPHAEAFAKFLGVPKDTYASLIEESREKPLHPQVMDKLAQVLGAKTKEEIIGWRKFMQNIPQELNQNYLDQCLGDGKEVDTARTGHDRMIAAARFVSILGKRHGLTDLTKLAEEIVPRGQQSIQLLDSLKRMMGAIYNAELNYGDKPAKPWPKSKIVQSAAAARSIAAYAYPDDPARQTACVDFFSSPKYLEPSAMNRTQDKNTFRER